MRTLFSCQELKDFHSAQSLSNISYYCEQILSSDVTLVQQWYEPWAVIRDCDQLPNIIAQSRGEATLWRCLCEVY